ncbi:MAG: pyridoxal phosphate-dependent aminotransferase family protein [Acidimicrobiales bacterium]
MNYLGLDLEPEVQSAVGPMVERWGTHPSWTRIVASPAPYLDLERDLARLTGAPDVLAFPTVTLAHLGVLPLLASPADTVVVDRAAHRSMQEAAELAAARGAALRWFDHRDEASLVRALDGVRGRPVVVVDGVYSMTGTVPDLAAIVDLVAPAGGLVYVDDAHGIGVLGRDPGGPEPYGTGGGGVVAHTGLSYDHIVYVGGLSKAFSSLAAFVTCRDPDERARFEQASTAVFSGPVPVASLATALAGLAVNAERGDELRRHLHRLTVRAIEGARERGWVIDNPLAFPVIKLVTGGVERTIAASRVMWEHGILFTPSVFPAAPVDRGGFRISLTAANTDDDVDRLLAALDGVTAALGPPPGRELLSPA